MWGLIEATKQTSTVTFQALTLFLFCPQSGPFTQLVYVLCVQGEGTRERGRQLTVRQSKPAT